MIQTSIKGQGLSIGFFLCYTVCPFHFPVSVLICGVIGVDTSRTVFSATRSGFRGIPKDSERVAARERYEQEGGPLSAVHPCTSYKTGPVLIRQVRQRTRSSDFGRFSQVGPRNARTSTQRDHLRDHEAASEEAETKDERGTSERGQVSFPDSGPGTPELDDLGAKDLGVTKRIQLVIQAGVRSISQYLPSQRTEAPAGEAEANHDFENLESLTTPQKSSPFCTG